MSKINKKQNPKIGINTILLRDAKGRNTKSYFKARFFYLRSPTGHTSKRQIFPKEIKKTADKELFLKKLLTQLFQINEKKRQQQRDYREKKAKREGRAKQTGDSEASPSRYLRYRNHKNYRRFHVQLGFLESL